MLGWMILSIVAFIALFAVLGINWSEETWKICKRQLFSVLGFVFFLPSFLAIVPANNVGILYSPFSGVSTETLAEGFHVVNPFTSVYNITTEVQSNTIKDVSTQTMDSQFVTNVFDVKYKVNVDNAYIVFKQFKTVEGLSDNLIAPTVQRAVENIVTQYNVMDFLGAKRNEIYGKINEALAVELEKFGVTFVSATLVDTDAGDDVEQAIKDEAIAKKAVETAKQELLKVETEAKQKSVQAQADKDAAKIKAETLLINANAEAKANKIVSESLTGLIVQNKLVEKWDTHLPTYVGSGDGSVIVNGIMSGTTTEAAK